MKTKIDEIREAFAEYERTEGCGCCRDYEGHEKASKILGELLGAKPYKDGSGYDFTEKAVVRKR